MAESHIALFTQLDIPLYKNTVSKISFTNYGIKKSDHTGYHIKNRNEIDALISEDRKIEGIIIVDHKVASDTATLGYWEPFIFGKKGVKYLGFVSAYKMLNESGMLEARVVDLGPQFNQEIPENVFWEGTHVLVLKGDFNQPIKSARQLPAKLGCLVLSSEYSYEIDTKILPPTLQEIIFIGSIGENVNQDITGFGVKGDLPLLGIVGRLEKKDFRKYQHIMNMELFDPIESNEVVMHIPISKAHPKDEIHKPIGDLLSEPLINQTHNLDIVGGKPKNKCVIL